MCGFYHDGASKDRHRWVVQVLWNLIHKLGYPLVLNNNIFVKHIFAGIRANTRFDFEPEKLGLFDDLLLVLSVTHS